MLPSPAFKLGVVEDKENGLRPFPLGLERGGWSLGSDEEEEGWSSSGSSSRDWELPGNWDSSDVVEGVLYRGIWDGGRKLR